ncbi:hypothetical protein P152DRAFT_58587 [Eremomyces bilateralis CBS 781.70]|uniref:Uncharacterized protein n=1 Tax=Eremomyces bilateralis CBS 781.70 TaxID=1392243 RepID=A0A6G1G082_9PEZI|nr:uncharacterized protein P152DRAFT_58587 [Eremomyces bilateralis CBS 781.70]KAF1811515.1 hypothetical protein P152DRAFT_58587 [Eremomyces bilateralis CBS 781.70]
MKSNHTAGHVLKSTYEMGDDAGLDLGLSSSQAGPEEGEPGLPPENFQPYLRNPKKRVRPKRDQHAEAVSENDARVAKLSRSIRWNHFFFHSCFEEDKLIQNVYGSVTADDVEWREAHGFIHAWSKCFKFETIRNMKASYTSY